MRDSQRMRVYRWEWRVAAELGDPVIGKEAALQFLRELESKYSVPSIKFEVMRSPRKRGFFRVHGNQISLSPSGMTRMLVLHEFAHAWAWATYGDKHAWHGSEFTNFYFNLLVEYMYPEHKSKLYTYAKCAGVNF